MKPACVMPSKPLPSVGASGESEPLPWGGVLSSVNRENSLTGRLGGFAFSFSTISASSRHSCSGRSVIGRFSPGARCGRSRKLNERGATAFVATWRAPAGLSGGTGASRASMPAVAAAASVSRESVATRPAKASRRRMGREDPGL
jgi:hypothetical protein